uniref:Putative tail protein n=1 Tax=viral metagenome TaxID=1070528 RepID=A0A6M3KH25_9ZZZZ
MKYDFSKYIKLKYKNLGRDFSGIDCFGLVWLIFKEERNIILPDFTTLNYNPDLISSNHKDIIIDTIDTNNTYKKVKPPYKMFDCPIFLDSCTLTFANHIGMFITDTSFIHIRENTTVMVSQLDNYYNSKLYTVIRID